MNPMRLYIPEECGEDGYPIAWHKLECSLCKGFGRLDAVYMDDKGPPTEMDCPACNGTGNLPVKDIVRAHAGHRCVRCLHPYGKGAGEWSPCDERCTHFGPLRYGTGPEFDPREAPMLGQPAGLLVSVALSPVQARWRILTVHHLDGVKRNLRWWNLVATCQRCHLQIQGKVQMARVWPWEHSTWFRPYVAGYYASVYLGEELERPEVEARLDELLALERVA